MYNSTERNDLRRRRSALTLAIALHLGLAAALYLTTVEKNQKPAQASQPVNLEKRHTGASPKVVNLP